MSAMIDVTRKGEEVYLVVASMSLGNPEYGLIETLGVMYTV